MQQRRMWGRLALAVILWVLTWCLLMTLPAESAPCPGAEEDCELLLVQQVYLPVVFGPPLRMSSIRGEWPTATPAVAPTMIADR
jgi:hypothetical protein